MTKKPQVIDFFDCKFYSLSSDFLPSKMYGCMLCAALVFDYQFHAHWHKTVYVTQEQSMNPEEWE